MTTAQYTQLTKEQRYTISALLQSGLSLPAIAQCVGVSRQTIWRELKRNTGKSGYRPLQAQRLSAARRKGVSRVTSLGRALIEHKIKQKWSPEQISFALTEQGWQDVPSTEWIYQHVYSSEGQAQSLRSELRCQKTYRKRGYKTRDRRGHIANKRSIHERPWEIEQRKQIGELEGDTMIGGQHKGALLTLVDRKSLYVWIEPLAHRHAKSTAAACERALGNFKANSITFDNGLEFAHHADIADSTGAAIYFADPYKSNQRARNENTNGLIRQYTPKSIPLDKVCPQFIKNVALELNNRPRKTLNWLSPAQVLAGIKPVALRS